jgi:hypothetical protein
MFGGNTPSAIMQNGMKGTGRYFILISWCVSSLFLILIPVHSDAQIKQPSRLELPISRNENSYEVLSAKESGLLLYRIIYKPSEALQLIHVDTAFQQKWGGILPLEPRLALIQQQSTKEKSYLLFYKRDFSEINFFLYEIDLQTGNYSKYNIRNYIPYLPSDMQVTGRGVLIGGYFAGRIPVILYYDFASMRSKVLPGLFNETGELVQIKVNGDDSFSIIINAKNQLRQRTLWIKNYSAAGELISNFNLAPQESSSLLFGRIINVNAERQLIAGVYGNRNSDYSKGIFLARIDSENEQRIEYYPFADLENFFKFMKASRENRVKQRIERKKIRGKKIRFQYRFLVHEFVPYNNEYILLGEAFYPKYRNIEQNLVYGLAPGRNLIFDGYQYTHAIVLGFDTTGKLLWDNSFEINDVRTFNLQQFVKMDVQEDKIALLYLFDDKIRSKIIQDNEVLEGKSYNQLLLKFDNSYSFEDISFNKLDYWYEDNFLAYGTQNIPASRAGGRGRQLFFINKLRYQ